MQPVQRIRVLSWVIIPELLHDPIKAGRNVANLYVALKVNMAEKLLLHIVLCIRPLVGH